jgi:mRNA interferase YafQ
VLKPGYAGQFKKDIKNLKKSGVKDMEKLKAVVRKLIDGKPLEGRYRDHALSGHLKGHRDCHIEPDWLLIYLLDRETQEITFVRTGSHSELFG